MTDAAKSITTISIEDEIKQSYLAYAMSVIVGRALPDVRDGLKPVHRRVLYAMHELNNDWNKPHKKSARVVGDVVGKYHPHGETAIYDTIVRMAQPFSMRYLLVDGQGNFGSVDGDAPAAMRYTEVRMSRFAHTLLADLEKETVDFNPNYDGSEIEPAVLPSKVPNLLVNGTAGIAVGMATNIPPHNLSEVIDACLALLNDPQLTVEDLMTFIPGPDFPTAAFINGTSGILEAYRTGRGRVVMRARTHVETDESTGKQSIIATELPYQVNKARLIEKIAELHKDKKIDGITGLRDESDKDGMRVVVELRRGEVAEVVLNNLFAQTQLQNVFGINMVALIDGQPRTMSLKLMLEVFLKHRREVVTRRSLFELRKAKERAHILEGLAIAISNIEPVIDLIKKSPDPQTAKKNLMSEVWNAHDVGAFLEKTDIQLCRPDLLGDEFGFSEQGYRLSAEQAQAILDLRLHRLTGLEKDKIQQEYLELIKQISNLMSILSDPDKLREVIQTELMEIKEQFGDVRRTEIMTTHEDVSLEDLISPEEVVVTLSHQGYVKTQAVDAYAAQRRGGRGKMAATMKDEDFISTLLTANTHDTILCFSSLGKVYWLKVYQLPQANRQSKGKPIVNLLPLSEGERISAILPVKEYAENQYVFMVTALGTVKKVALSHFSRPRNGGIIALGLEENDYLIGAAITMGDQDIMLFSDAGKVIRFHESKVRTMGRTAQGVRGILLQPEQKVISLIVANPTGTILTATENGYGKRTPLNEYRLTSRGGQGIISIQVSERNGKVIGAIQVEESDDIMLISDRGTLVRTRVSEISSQGRNTQGVTLIRLSTDEKLVGLSRIQEGDEEESDVDM